MNAYRDEERAEEAIGARTAWTVAEMAVAAKAWIEPVERDLNRLFEANSSMVGSLCLNTVVPNTIN